MNAKYLPDESASRVLLRRQVRSANDVSDISLNSNSNDSDDVDNNEDNDDDSSSSTDLDTLERKIVHREQEIIWKQEEEKRKREQKLAEELRKQEEKRIKEERKKQEKLEKEERKRLEQIEKEILKQEELERKRQEKIEKEERKRQKKIIKQLEKLEKESTEIEESSESIGKDQSLELDDIGKIYIYEKYGLSPFSTDLEKKAAVNRFLREELGLNINSTKSERRQAIVAVINNKLLKENETSRNFKNYVINHVTATDIQRTEAKLEKKIIKLENERALLNNITLPWVTEAQENIQETRIFLQALQSLSNLFSSWISGDSQSTFTTVSDNSIPNGSETSSTIAASSNNESATITVNVDQITIIQSSSSNITPTGTEGSVESSISASAEPSTGSSNSTDNTFVTTESLNPSGGASTTTTTSVSSTVTEINQIAGSGDASTSENNELSSSDSTLTSFTDLIQITSQEPSNIALPNNGSATNDSQNLGTPTESQGTVSTTVADKSESSVNIDATQITFAPTSEIVIPGDNPFVNTTSDTPVTATSTQISTGSDITTSSAISMSIINVTESSISGTEVTLNSADSSVSGVSDLNSTTQAPIGLVNTSKQNNPTTSSDIATNTVIITDSLTTGSLIIASSPANELTGSVNDVTSGSVTTTSVSTNSDSLSVTELLSSSNSISGHEIISSTKPTVTDGEPSVTTVISIPVDSLSPVDILATVSTDVSSSTIEISTPASVQSNLSGISSTKGNTSVNNVTETIKDSNEISMTSTTKDSLSTILNVIDAFITTTTSGSDIVSTSASEATLIVGDNKADISTIPNQATVVADPINTSGSTTFESVTGPVATGSSDVNTIMAESATTTLSYSSSSSDVTISQEPQTIVNPQIVTEAIKLDGTTTVILDNSYSTNTVSETLVPETILTTENSALKQTPTEINTPETNIMYTERTEPHVVVIPGEAGARIIDVQPQ